MPIETNRALGGYGAVLSVLGVISTGLTLFQYGVFGYSSRLSASSLGLLAVSSVVGFLVFIGFILFFIALYGFSRDYREPRIFNYILYGLLGSIISSIVIFAAWFAFVMANVFNMIPRIGSSPSSTEIQTLLTPYLAPLIAVASVVMLIWIFFNVKAYNLMADKSGVPLFRTSAKLLLLAAILNIVMGVVFAALALNGAIDYGTLLLALVPGGITSYASQAVLAFAFFRIKPILTPSSDSTNVSTNATIVKNCPNCGTANQQDSLYCIKCGQKL